MASTQEQHNISETAPHFFKFLHDGSIQQAKLKIPGRFVSKHGKDISDPVLLKDPSGTEWRVKLTKCCSTGAWSLDGLREFMEYYSLQFGHFLLFRYEGRSSFCFIICDKSASEIEYPVGDKNASVQEGNSNGKEPSKVSEAGRTRFNGACSENHKRKSCSYSGFEDVVGGGFMASGTRKTLVASRKSRALQMASSFKSKKPFFSIAMQPSYVCDRFRMNVPSSFTAKYFLKDCDSIDLRVSNGGTWRVKYIRYVLRAYSTPRVEFNIGWKKFAQDNKLVAGDVCVFELNTGADSSLEVSIYRSCEDSSSHGAPRMKVPKIEDTCDDSSLGRASITRLDTEKTSTVCLGARSNAVKLEKPKRKSGLNSHRELEAKGGGGHAGTCKKQRISGISRRTTALSSDEMARALQMATSLVKPESPFFMVPMQPSYAILRLMPDIPRAFVHEHFPNKDHGDIILRDSNDKAWPVKYGSIGIQHYAPRIKFTCSWKEFFQGHDLEVGDSCIFELLDDIKLSLKVTILRVNEYADDHHCFKRREKNVESETLKLEMPKKNLLSGSMHGSGDSSRRVTRQETISKHRSKCPPFRGGGSSASGQRLLKHETSGTVKQIAASGKGRALQMAASSFKSENPYFEVSMQPSYIYNRFRLTIPLSIITKYFLEDRGYVNLLLANGGLWRVTYVRYTSRCNNNPKVEFTFGWEAFARDNNLKVGDVCVFELVGGSEKSLQVFIFRSSEDASIHDSMRMKVLEIESTSEVPVETQGKASLTRRRPQKTSNADLLTQPNGVKLEKPERKRGLSSKQGKEGGKKQRISQALQMATSSVKSESPFFTVTMQPSYVSAGSRLRIPSAFARNHFPNKNHCDVILRDSNDRTWPVKYITRHSQYHSPITEFTHGWKEFMQEHDLEVDDACVFELVDGVEFSLKVTISLATRYADGNRYERRKLIKAEESGCVYGSSDNLSPVTRSESAAEHRSGYPFFQVTMHGSFLNSGLSVPKGFVRKHIKERSCSVKLQVADKSWNVEFRIYKDGSCKFCQFPSFARANSLRGGDDCIFELIESEEMLFKVSIVRQIKKTGLHSQTHWLGQYILSKS